MGTVSASYTSSTSSSVREAANSGFFAHRAEQDFAPQQKLIANIQAQQKGYGDTENDDRLKEFDALDTTFRQQERDLTLKLQSIVALYSRNFNREWLLKKEATWISSQHPLQAL